MVLIHSLLYQCPDPNATSGTASDHISIKAIREDNPMNGVSTLDLVLYKNIYSVTEALKSPYKMIAADVDNSNDITVLDLLELRKLILGIYDKLPNNSSWKFIPKAYTFKDVTALGVILRKMH